MLTQWPGTGDVMYPGGAQAHKTMNKPKNGAGIGPTIKFDMFAQFDMFAPPTRF